MLHPQRGFVRCQVQSQNQGNPPSDTNNVALGHHVPHGCGLMSISRWVVQARGSCPVRELSPENLTMLLAKMPRTGHPCDQVHQSIKSARHVHRVASPATEVV